MSKQRVYIVNANNGLEYEDYQESIYAVFLVPKGHNTKDLRRQYVDLHPLRQLHTMKQLENFCKWLESRGFQRMKVDTYMSMTVSDRWGFCDFDWSKVHSGTKYDHG
jgi:hypothetical protein